MAKWIVLALSCACASKKTAIVVTPAALEFHKNAVVIDMHADTTEPIFYENYDLLALHADRHVDLPRMQQGGLDAEVFSVFVHPESVDLTQFFSTAIKQIDQLQQVARTSGGKLAFARN